MIATTRGYMDELDMEKREGVVDVDSEHSTWTEYWYEGERIKRIASDMVMTLAGLMDVSLLEKRMDQSEDDNEHTKWIEYWYLGELVHRSVSIRLKKAVFAFGEAKSLG